MYRTIDTATWDDPWFAELTATDKLLFLYLLTNRRSTPCGAFEITPKQMVFETGLIEAEITASLARLAPKILWWPDIRVVLIRNFYKHQRANSSFKYVPAAQKALANFPCSVRNAVLQFYPELANDTEWVPDQEDTLPIGYEEGIDRESVVKLSKERVKLSKEREKERGEGKVSEEEEDEPSSLDLASPSSRAKPKRRIPRDFTVTDDMKAWAATNGIAALVDLDFETEEFRDYWIGDGGTKSDWIATWRNSMRKKANYAKDRSNGNGRHYTQNGNGYSEDGPNSSKDQRTAASIRAKMERRANRSNGSNNYQGTPDRRPDTA